MINDLTKKIEKRDNFITLNNVTNYHIDCILWSFQVFLLLLISSTILRSIYAIVVQFSPIFASEKSLIAQTILIQKTNIIKFPQQTFQLNIFYDTDKSTVGIGRKNVGLRFGILLSLSCMRESKTIILHRYLQPKYDSKKINAASSPHRGGWCGTRRSVVAHDKW